MTPIPSSYLSRDLYRRTWVEPGPTTERAAPPPRDGRRPWWRPALARLRRALDGHPATPGRPVRLRVG